LNLVERWFAELSNKWLRLSAHRSVAELRAANERWLLAWNENPRPFVGTKSADRFGVAIMHENGVWPSSCVHVAKSFV
jgi:hypothetical protein